MAAFRNAIEQAFGTFVSSNTNILNDKLVKDEIVSLSSGNIQKFEILNSSILPDKSTVVTLKAVISVSKLINFSEAKGVEIEFKGGLFTLNIKQQILNEQAEEKAVWDMLFILNPIAHQSIDYSLSNEDPKSMGDEENKSWSIPIKVKAIANKNFEFLFSYLKHNISLIALPEDEVLNYKKLNKGIYQFVLDDITYNLRKKESLYALNKFFHEFQFYCSNFYLDDGSSKRKCGNLEGNTGFSGFESHIPPPIIKFKDDNLHHWNEPEKGQYYLPQYYWTSHDFNYISLLSGVLVAEYTFNDIKTLKELEQLKGYKIYPAFPINKIGTWFAGGKIFYEDSLGGGLVCNLNPIEGVSKEESNDGKAKGIWGCTKTFIPNTSSKLGSGKKNTKLIIDNCKEEGIAARLCIQSNKHGYKDWFLPSIDELKLAYENLNLKGCYWSSTQKEKTSDKSIEFVYGITSSDDKKVEVEEYHKEEGFEYQGTTVMPDILPIRAY